MGATLVVALLLFASPALATPVCDGCVLLPILSGGLNNGFFGVSTNVVTSAFSGVATDPDQVHIGVQSGPAGSTVHIIFSVGGFGTWIYQGQTYHAFDINFNRDTWAGWNEQAVVTVVLGVDVDTAPATIDGTVSFNNPGSFTLFGLTGTGTASRV